jgi:hypothetical protein
MLTLTIKSSREQLRDMQESDPTPNFGSFGEPAWLTTDDEEIVRVRTPLVGDYNMWVNLTGGNRDLAKKLLIQDFPRGPLEGGSDENLKAYLGSKAPWLWAYIAFQYRAGIFNTLTFVVLIAIMAYIAFVYVPRDERSKKIGRYVPPIVLVRSA